MIHNNNRHSNAPCGCQYYKRANTLLNVMIATISTTKYNYYHPNTCIRKEILKETISVAWWIFVNYLPIRYASSTKSSSCIFCYYHAHISSWIFSNTLRHTDPPQSNTLHQTQISHHSPTQNNHLHHTLEYNAIIVMKWKKQITNKDT